LIFVLTAGIIPCPGTVLLFVYAFLLKTYFAVILASISISLGMALVIFASSFLGVSLNKASSKSKKLVNILEIAKEEDYPEETVRYHLKKLGIQL